VVTDLRSYIIEVLQNPARAAEAEPILTVVRKLIFDTRIYPVKGSHKTPDAPGPSRPSKIGQVG